MRPPQPQRVVGMPVDALGIVTSPVQHFEVRIARRDLTHVLRPVELAFRVFDVRMQVFLGNLMLRSAAVSGCAEADPMNPWLAQH